MLNNVITFVKKVPLPLWAGVCLAVAVFYIGVWPSGNNPGDVNGLRYFVLRWFHPLAWVLLALSCLVRATRIATFRPIAKCLAFLALPTYATFFLMLLV